MLRTILTGLGLLSPSALAAQADKDAIIITGVVDSHGGGSGVFGHNGTWTGSFNLVVWRQDDGPIQRRTLRVEIPNQKDSQLDRWATIFPARKLVRIAIEAPVETGEFRDLARLRAPLEATPDPDLLAAADPILNPPAFVDLEFGEFTPDTTDPEILVQRRDWLGRRVELMLDLGTEKNGVRADPAEAIETLRAVWTELEAWDARIREAIAKEYYPLWLEEWRQESEPLLDREAFKRRFRLSESIVHAHGSFGFYYEDDDLFGGHAMAVNYDPQADELDVVMVG
ncbi:MAG: DUF2262 domain-containing protein [Pseudomonadota bacterium]